MRKIRLTIDVTMHSDGARFYEWSICGDENVSAEQLLKGVGKDLLTSQCFVLKRKNVEQKEEGE